jgi:hypothetical protein
MSEITFNGGMQTLFVVAANITLRSSTFSTVIQSLVQCQMSPSVFLFKHIRYFELFRGQLRTFYPDQVNSVGDDIANAMVIIWEVDRLIPQSHWNHLKSYVARFSSTFNSNVRT